MWPLLMVLAAGVPDWVPVRWFSADPQSLELLRETPINCVLVEQAHWGLAGVAREKQLIALGVVRPPADVASAAQAARKAGLQGLVLEGDFPAPVVEKARAALDGLALVVLPPRRAMTLDSSAPVVGTTQGLWPGIRVMEDGKHHAAPSGAPWIDTNSGFLRFLRAATGAPVWVAQVPPDKEPVPAQRYLQAIGDAAMVGARWVVALDADMQKKLLAKDANAVRDWKRITDHLRFYEQHADWRGLRPYGLLALVQDADSGALFSGGVLDMIAVKHTPVLPVPSRALKPGAMTGATMAVNVDPSSLSDPQREVVRSFTKAGGTVLSGPPGWKMPVMKGDQVTLGENEVKTLDEIWRDVNHMTGRRNLGARLFNVSSMLSSLLATPDAKTVVLHLVNYSDYPVESITVHLLGKYRKARLLTPEKAEKAMELYDVEEGTGVDIDGLNAVGTLVLER